MLQLRMTGHLRSNWGKEAARFAENRSSGINNLQNAPLPSSKTPQKPVIPNESTLDTFVSYRFRVDE
jgi:hypothetical protein